VSESLRVGVFICECVLREICKRANSFVGHNILRTRPIQMDSELIATLRKKMCTCLSEDSGMQNSASPFYDREAVKRGTYSVARTGCDYTAISELRF